MKPQLINEADKIWKRLSKSEAVKELKFDLEVYKLCLIFLWPADTVTKLLI